MAGALENASDLDRNPRTWIFVDRRRFAGRATALSKSPMTRMTRAPRSTVLPGDPLLLSARRRRAASARPEDRSGHRDADRKDLHQRKYRDDVPPELSAVAISRQQPRWKLIAASRCSARRTLEARTRPEPVLLACAELEQVLAGGMKARSARWLRSGCSRRARRALKPVFGTRKSVAFVDVSSLRCIRTSRTIRQARQTAPQYIARRKFGASMAARASSTGGASASTRTRGIARGG